MGSFKRYFILFLGKLFKIVVYLSITIYNKIILIMLILPIWGN